MNNAAYKLHNLIRSAKVTDVRGGDFFDEEITINPEYVKGLLTDLEKVRGAATRLIAQTDKSACIDEIMYFVNQFHQESGDLIDYLNVTGESLLDDDQIRAHLIKIQFHFIKIAAIYEAYHMRDYPDITFLADYLEKHRANVIETILEEVGERKVKAGLLEEGTDPEANQFKSELVEYLTIIHFKIIRILFLYFTLYQASPLDASLKKHLTSSIANAIHLLIKIQKQTNNTTNTLNIKPSDLLHDLYQIFSQLEVFTRFTQQYIQTHPYQTQFQPAPVPIIEPLQSTQTPKGLVEIFIDRDCRVCKQFFDGALWSFVQQVARKLALQIKLYDISEPENEALCQGIYDIQRVPTLKYKDGLFWINPATEEGPDPSRKAFRDVLNFFGILGLYTYEITSREVPSEKEEETDRTIRIRIDPHEKSPL